jgi:drug/metabolite transporter (DMT)-like permease
MTERKISRAGLAHLGIVYLVWGSTYLAIRIGVRPGAGFTPFIFGTIRVLPAGIILLLIALLRNKSLKLDRRDFITLFLSGFFLWIGGNGLVVWSEQQVDSALAALIVATVPIWVAGLDAVLDRKRPKLMLLGSLLVGFLGILVLSMPVLLSGVRADLVSVLTLVLASLSWSIGLTIQARRPVKVSRGVSSGYQQLFGGLMFFLIAWLGTESWTAPTLEAWGALIYLIIFGSILAFTSFVSVLQLLPTSIATTYAYVNPIIAVFLGWLILSEPITYWTLAGALFVLLGVSGVYREGRKSRKQNEQSR